ncbi:MAG: amidohydrolase [Clostridia bacterium]|nr:amidohydrolase [Clostridia bacterium]
MKRVYHNAVVYTGKWPLCQAFAVEDGRFLFAGSDAEALALPADERIDLGGAFVCAGFNDSHMHVLNFGQSLTAAQLHLHTQSLDDMIACLRAQKPGRGGWIVGRGWNQDFFAGEKRMPTRWDLDRVSLKHPVVATRACGHALCVNSRALELLAITADTPQIAGGEIVMENGAPNGVFLDNAMDLVLDRIPAPDREGVKNMLRAAMKALGAYGVTSCQSDDYCAFHALNWREVNAAYRELEAAGEMTVRVYEQSNFADTGALAQFIAEGNTTGAGTDFFKIGPLKLLGDGALGARTAYLSRSYADAPDTRGLSVFTPEQFDALIGLANEHGMQIAVHCIGDACLDLVLGSLDKALAAHPRVDHRHGIVHCQITRADQLERIAKMGLHVYCQSIFLDYDIHIVRERAGEALAQTSYSWKTLMNKGATVSNGSDCPVELPRVLLGIQCAVTRRDLKLCAPYLPDEAFTVREAIDSFTSAGAHASFEENVKGQIAPGMLADFVILGGNPYETDAERIKDIPVLATYVGGKCVYKTE